MKKRDFKSRFLSILAIGALLPLSAYAGTKTATMNISMTVTPDCTITAAPLSFGSGSVMKTAVTQQTNLSLTCTNTVPYQVALDEGTVAGSTTATRLMTGSSSNTLQFNMYRDAGYTQVWGKTAGTDTYAGTGTGTLQTIPVYGQIPVQTNVAPDSFSTTITATVTF